MFASISAMPLENRAVGTLFSPHIIMQQMYKAVKHYISCNATFIVLEFMSLHFALDLTSKWHNVSITELIWLTLLWQEAIYCV